MPIEVSLTTKGRIGSREVAGFLGELSARPADVTYAYFDEASGVDHYEIEFRNPFNRRVSRTIRVHMAGDLNDTRCEEHLGSGEYTNMVLGSGGDGERIMRALAERFGGCLANDEGYTFEYVEPVSASAPKP